ncbi:MAG: hypothetical protein L6R42_008728 [Xanthoria sp. 1 TBL-2021]|nr:MAG: hypothetical protein L6R42_008728 [Xanthoria sp. 1 TBL-2021]
MLTHHDSTKASNQTIDPWIDACRKPQTRIRILAAIPRSGSTLIMQVFGEAPECAVTSRLVLMGNYGVHGDFHPTSHPVYQEAVSGRKSILISKEELGHDCSKGECDYNFFPDAASIEHTKAAFLFRDPIRIFDSWKAVGWTDVQSLLIAYRKLFNTWAANQQSAIAFTYEEMINQPEVTIARLCRHWDINFSQQLLSFKHPFGNGFLFSSDRERRIYTTDNPLGLFNTIQSNTSINANIKNHGLLTTAEKDLIERNLSGLYMATYGDRIQSIKDALSSRTHFGFDLDDTLHSFRKASGAASAAVFEHLASATTSTPTKTPPTIEELKTTYTEILSRTTSTAFADGKTSTEYRKDRFTALMQAHNLNSPNNEETLSHLLTLYKHTLQASLSLKPGAAHLLSKLKSLGKTIVVITEGPEDAQRWTLEQLGIAEKIDVLMTSNAIGKSKTEGLFGEVLGRLGIAAEKMVVVGDSVARDVEPAKAEGILTVLYDEGGSVRLEVEGEGEGVSVNSLWKLGELLSERRDDGIGG